MAGDLRDPKGTSFSGLSVGSSDYSAGTALFNLSSITIPVVATTVVATKSTETTHAFPGLVVGDHVLASCSALSAGVVLTAQCEAANVVTLRYSNVSTANAAQTAQTVRATRLGF